MCATNVDSDCSFRGQQKLELISYEHLGCAASSPNPIFADTLHLELRSIQELSNK